MRNLAKITSAAILSSALTMSVAMAQATKCEGDKCPLPPNMTEGMGGKVEGGAKI